MVISLAAQVKMALHATKHGLSDNQVHGIVLGRTANSDDGDGGDGWRVTDVVPVCHEAPTKSGGMRIGRSIHPLSDAVLWAKLCTQL